jgi:hypothetical protein
MKNYTALAIHKLKPNSSWRFENYDYSTIEWFELEGTAPTQAEIDAAIEQIKADEITEAAAKVKAKIEAEAKLKKLGLTSDDLKALGLI